MNLLSQDRNKYLNTKEKSIQTQEKQAIHILTFMTHYSIEKRKKKSTIFCSLESKLIRIIKNFKSNFS